MPSRQSLSPGSLAVVVHVCLTVLVTLDFGIDLVCARVHKLAPEALAEFDSNLMLRLCTLFFWGGCFLSPEVLRQFN